MPSLTDSEVDEDRRPAVAAAIHDFLRARDKHPDSNVALSQLASLLSREGDAAADVLGSDELLRDVYMRLQFPETAPASVKEASSRLVFRLVLLSRGKSEFGVLCARLHAIPGFDNWLDRWRRSEYRHFALAWNYARKILRRAKKEKAKTKAACAGASEIPLPCVIPLHPDDEQEESWARRAV